MPQKKQQAKALIQKYKEGTCSEKEKIMVEQWYEQLPTDTFDLHQSLMEEDLDKVWLSMQTAKGLHIRRKRMTYFSRIAATVLVGISLFAGYRFLQQPEKREQTKVTVNDIFPKGNRAILTLSNGQSIHLNEHKKGIVIADDNLIYNDGTSLKENNGLHLAHTIQHQQLSTPKGGQYQITLSDGTQVWLNAASSLNYPAHFTGQARVVELTGEAYFEVAHQVDEQSAKVPFIVKTAGQEVEVLGTHFSINAYQDEPITKTTLLEGSVRVSQTGGPGTSVLLKPGEQAVLRADALNVSPISTAETVSWKDGYFDFVNADLKGVMRELSRWYDIEVRYETERTGDEFMGQIPRSVGLTKALKILELGGVEFKREGRVLTIIK